jgi:ferredoxin
VEKRVVLKTLDLGRFFKGLSSRYDVYYPVKEKNQRFFKKYTGSAEGAILGEVRPFEPLKAFFSRARERVAEDFKSELPRSQAKPLAMVGVKACDLKGFKIQEYVFGNHGSPDPFYVRNREQNLIISADCTCAIDTCFCLALGVQPHPRENFDLNFSPIKEGFVVEVGSAKGQLALDENPSLFRPATGLELEARDVQRAEVTQLVEQNLKQFDVPREDRFAGIIERNHDSEIWKDEAKTCVECGACTQICPTCHCFLLYDQKDENHMARLRVWDSCLLKDYARVAGGANPRKQLWMRLRNRFEKKFDFFPKVVNLYACTGCGRCISACPAKIDIRRVLRRLVANA